MKLKLNTLAAFINELSPGIVFRCFTDSAPVMEKTLAQQAGLGWIGKNSCLINHNVGSFCFIGSIFTNLDLEIDEPAKNHCGNCMKCVNACPTGAIVENGIIDSRMCISYLTIEYKGEINPGVAKKFSNQIFGCDICQDVCPWNTKNTKLTTEPAFSPNSEIATMDDEHWENLTETSFKRIFKDSAVKRAKFEGLKRNINNIFLNRK